MNLKNLYKKYQKYLPSKKFAITVCVVFAGAFILYMSFFRTPSKDNAAQNTVALKIENQSVNDLIAKDTDSDGIADWEEALWGTNKNIPKTFNDTPDSAYIANKKKELNIETSVNASKLTETDKFAREFFTSFSALKASGQVDSDTINNFSSALGEKIVTPDLIDRYTEADVKTNNNNDSVSEQKYYADVKKLFQSYESSNIGDELDIVNTGLISSPTTTPTSYNKLPVIANAYQDFAKKLIAMSVPSELAIYHLQIANSSNNIGIAVGNMAKIVTDPLVGLEGLSEYQQYSDDLVKTVANLETRLAQ